VYLVKNNFADGIITIDSDVWIAGRGGSTLPLDISWGRMETFKVNVGNVKSGSTENNLPSLKPEEGIVMAAIYSCDCATGTKRIGEKTYRSIKDSLPGRTKTTACLVPAIKDWLGVNVFSEESIKFTEKYNMLKKMFANMPVFALEWSNDESFRSSNIFHLSGDSLFNDEWKK